MVKVILDCEQLPRPGIATLCSCAGREDWRLLGGTHACTGGIHCQQKMEGILRIKMKTSTNRAGVAKLYAKPRFSKQIKISFDALTFSI